MAGVFVTAFRQEEEGQRVCATWQTVWVVGTVNVLSESEENSAETKYLFRQVKLTPKTSLAFLQITNYVVSMKRNEPNEYCDWRKQWKAMLHCVELHPTRLYYTELILVNFYTAVLCGVVIDKLEFHDSQ